MAYQIPPDVEKLVNEQMIAGGYESADEVLREALKALDVYKQLFIEEEPEVVEGVRRGLEEMNQGLGRPVEEFDNEFRAQNKLPRNG